MQTSTGALAGSRRGGCVGRGPFSATISEARGNFVERPPAGVSALRLAASASRLKRALRRAMTPRSKKRGESGAVGRQAGWSRYVNRTTHEGCMRACAHSFGGDQDNRTLWADRFHSHACPVEPSVNDTGNGSTIANPSLFTWRSRNQSRKLKLVSPSFNASS